MKEIYVKGEKAAKEFGVRALPEGIPEIEVNSQEDMAKIRKLEAQGVKEALVSCPNWKVIPLENLIALSKKLRIIARAQNVEEAKMAFQILEKGVDGVLFENGNAKDIAALKEYLQSTDTLQVTSARITTIRRVGLGARSCIDTGDILDKDDGMLVGSTSGGFVLMQPEVNVNPHVAPRPFRVNAGSVSLYVLVEGGKTKYLAELKAGDMVLVVGRNGSARAVTVVRNKIEYRPMMLIECMPKEGGLIKIIVQEAETIRVLTPGSPGSKSVAELKEGDEVLANVQKGGRHFGMAVEETIIEQ